MFKNYSHVIQTSYGDRKIQIVVSKGIADSADEESTYPLSGDSFSRGVLRQSLSCGARREIRAGAKFFYKSEE